MHELTAERIARPETVGDIVAYVSVGNSLIDLCEIWGVVYAVVSNWMRAEHKEEYESALLTRGEYIDVKILDEVRKIALADIRSAFDDEGALKDVKEWSAEFSASVSSLESHDILCKDGSPQGKIKKIKFWDKLKALELLGKNRRLFRDDTIPPININLFQKNTSPELTAEKRIEMIEESLRGQ